LDSAQNTIKKFFDPYIQGLTNLVFPENCIACETELAQLEEYICNFCQDTLKKTYFESFKEPSMLDKLFWGRILLEHTFALFYFKSNTPAQTILHNLKYKHKAKLGVYCGGKIGQAIQSAKAFNGIDALIPVPLHHKKAFNRGYNQSEMLAIGISSVLKIPVLKNAVKKTQHTESQTKKNKFERWDNVNQIFKGKKLKDYNHIAIVDDVVTTGSTLESLASQIQQENPHLKISIIALAFAKS
jgi:competence protein ComFC